MYLPVRCLDFNDETVLALLGMCSVHVPRNRMILFQLFRLVELNCPSVFNTVVWVIFAVKIFSLVALCAKIKLAEFSFLTVTHIYPGSYWVPSHKLELRWPLHTKYLCKYAGHEHKMSTLINSSSSITSRAQHRSNIFVRLILVHLIFPIMRDHENFLPWIFIPGKFAVE